jgi:23S rRNA pseudouridine2604 synthase
MQLKGCSRAQAEQYIADGWVQVDGAVVHTPQLRVLRQSVLIDPAATLQDATPITLVLHKPAGWQDGVDTRGESRAKNSRSLLKLAQHWDKDASGVRPLQRHLDRLDALVPLETGASGLVVFTQDWRTQRKLTEDMGSLEHELLVDVAGLVPGGALQKIARSLHDERMPLPQTKFSVSSSTPERSTLRFAVKGAHPGLVAHLCDRAGLTLLAMRRIRVGRVQLRDVPQGQWRYLAPFEKF